MTVRFPPRLSLVVGRFLWISGLEDEGLLDLAVAVTDGLVLVSWAVLRIFCWEVKGARVAGDGGVWVWHSSGNRMLERS